AELSAESRTCMFESKKDYILHLLSLWTICLGGTTKDEMHVIAVETDQTQGHPVVIASLKPSLQPMVNLHGMELTSPVTFMLESGSGPVYISGQHITLDDGLEGLEPEEENLRLNQYYSTPLQTTKEALLQLLKPANQHGWNCQGRIDRTLAFRHFFPFRPQQTQERARSPHVVASESEGGKQEQEEDEGLGCREFVDAPPQVR
ncbi:PREDICTED: nucleoplasmin ATPase-like, partial [Nanorana parkeri]|uniref:nucleoplasmin ATPase-like n=1 Tax=Nanorana parkeri TaxID=125878 RepID=UPI000854185D